MRKTGGVGFSGTLSRVSQVFSSKGNLGRYSKRVGSLSAVPGVLGVLGVPGGSLEVWQRLGRKKYVFRIYMILADFARPGTAL